MNTTRGLAGKRDFHDKAAASYIKSSPQFTKCPRSLNSRSSRNRRDSGSQAVTKGSWQQGELAAELGVSSSAISKVVKDRKASASDHSLQRLLSCDYLRPTSGTMPRVETRGNRGRIAKGKAPATATRKAAVDRYGCLGLYTDARVCTRSSADLDPSPYLNAATGRWYNRTPPTWASKHSVQSSHLALEPTPMVHAFAIIHPAAQCHAKVEMEIA